MPFSHVSAMPPSKLPGGIPAIQIKDENGVASSPLCATIRNNDSMCLVSSVLKVVRHFLSPEDLSPEG